jgi:hypothetical protein
VLLRWMVLALLTQAASSGTRVEMEFVPESPKFEAAAATYQKSNCALNFAKRGVITVVGVSHAPPGMKFWL